MTMNHKKAVFLTCCVALLWSTFGLLVKLIDWPSPAIAGGRSIIAALILTPFILKSQNKKITPYVISGALCYAAFNYCFSMSTKLATAAIAIAMQYTAPVYVSILAWIFLREKISKSDVICIFLVLCGMFLFMLDGTSSGSALGKFLAVLNGIFFAGMSFSLRLQRHGNPVMSRSIGQSKKTVQYSYPCPNALQLIFIRRRPKTEPRKTVIQLQRSFGLLPEHFQAGRKHQSLLLHRCLSRPAAHIGTQRPDLQFWRGSYNLRRR